MYLNINSECKYTHIYLINNTSCNFFCPGAPLARFWARQTLPAKRTLRPAGLGRPLVYVVAWQQAEQTVLSLLECGVDQYMTFPVSLQRLRTKIANALNRQL